MSKPHERPPRVWWVNQYAGTPDRPGGTRHHEMAAELIRRGRDVVIVASDMEYGGRSYSRRPDARSRCHLKEVVAGVPFLWLPAGRFERNDWRRAVSMVVFAAHEAVTLLRNVRRHDVVIGSSPQLPAAFVAWIVARLRGAATIHEVRDLWPESLVQLDGRTTPLARILRWMADLLYRRSDAIVVLARGSVDAVAARGAPRSRIHWIPNGVAVNQATAPLPRDLAWVRDFSTFVYAGAHGPANGLDVLLDAAEILRLNGDAVDERIRILLVGDGTDRDRLAHRVATGGIANVVMHVPIPKVQVRALLDACTGGLMVLRDVPLFRSGVSPNKLFDYLAADLPVITNVAGEVAEVVVGSGGGIAVPPSDAPALAAAIRRIASEGWPRGTGPEYVKAYHERTALAAALDDVIAQVLTRRHSPAQAHPAPTS